ncbi:hypothetical protein L211DRAFT_838697 [Terfezia boudieri ATCC MYA-4762]|uniref:Uncharacterized protein n=1 Tax=Terfezia boudieri ATCC MYA-4762 TaxID=1051890 RepID=A0A3N4LZP4_9PEZI|nr:hypothetical protein L211DRAFT_838697 [Terfezia boudieri ATCC MYA-4762]
MPGKGKRKDNSGKMDRVNPLLKIRIPVTDHPKPQHDMPMHDTSDTSDTSNTSDISDTSAMTAAALLFAREIIKHTESNHCSTPLSASRAIWCLRELLTYIRGDVARIFRDEVFEKNTKWFANKLNNGSTTWVNSSRPIWPRRTESSTQTTPPPQSSLTIPPIASPTPKPKLLTNSISTNTDSPPTRTYAEVATTISSPKKTILSRTLQLKAIILHMAPMKYKPSLMCCWIKENNEGARILGIRWLLQEGRRVGKLASSLIIYLAEGIDTRHGLCMGRRIFHTSE